MKKNKKQIIKVAAKTALTLTGFGTAATLVNDILSLPSADVSISQVSVSQQSKQTVNNVMENIGSNAVGKSGATKEYLQELNYNSRKNSF